MQMDANTDDKEMKQGARLNGEMPAHARTRDAG